MASSIHLLLTWHVGKNAEVVRSLSRSGKRKLCTLWRTTLPRRRNLVCDMNISVATNSPTITCIFTWTQWDWEAHYHAGWATPTRWRRRFVALLRQSVAHSMSSSGIIHSSTRLQSRLLWLTDWRGPLLLKRLSNRGKSVCSMRRPATFLSWVLASALNSDNLTTSGLPTTTTDHSMVTCCSGMRPWITRDWD